MLNNDLGKLQDEPGTTCSARKQGSPQIRMGVKRHRVSMEGLPLARPTTLSTNVVDKSTD